MATEKRTCLECGTTLNGRKDQKFCGDYCRNTFNNKQNEDVNNYMRRINNILRKNRRILDKLNPEGMKTVDLMALAEEGFNFHYYTNTYTTKKGVTYFFCYDRGYSKTEDNKFILVHKQEYVK
jgi:predicted nucleic acid-binding Zn ribbon protein